ncbi:MAG: OadG family protein [bacterium]
MSDALVNMSIGDAGITALLGYAVVFVGIFLLMAVIVITGKVMTRLSEKEKTPVSAPAPAPVEVKKPQSPAAPGSCGDVKLYDTDPRTAAMIMAIVADKMGKPLNELRFKSIKEVK